LCWFEIRKDPTQTCEPNPNPCNPAQNPKLKNQPKATQTQLKPAAQPFLRPTPPSPSPGPTPLSFPSRDRPRQPPRSARATAQRSPPPARSPPRVALSPCAPGPSVGAARPHHARASPAPLTERPHPSAPTCQPVPHASARVSPVPLLGRAHESGTSPSSRNGRAWHAEIPGGLSLPGADAEIPGALL